MPDLPKSLRPGAKDPVSAMTEEIVQDAILAGRRAERQEIHACLVQAFNDLVEELKAKHWWQPSRYTVGLSLALLKHIAEWVYERNKQHNV